MTWPRAILLDLDGTLADSAPDIADALNRLMQMEGLPEFPLEAVTRMVGGGVPLLIERALAAHGKSSSEDRVSALVPRFMEIYVPRAANKTRLFPGAREFLDDCVTQGVKLGVCTNKPEAVTRSMLADLGVAETFGAVIGGDTLKVKKPDPGPVFAALEKLGCKPEQGLMIGDSGADAHAARAAGIPVILVSFGYTQTPVAELPHDALADSFAEIPGLIKQLREARGPS